MCKIMRVKKLMCPIFMTSTKKKKKSQSFGFTFYIYIISLGENLKMEMMEDRWEMRPTS